MLCISLITSDTTILLCVFIYKCTLNNIPEMTLGFKQWEVAILTKTCFTDGVFGGTITLPGIDRCVDVSTIYMLHWAISQYL